RLTDRYLFSLGGMLVVLAYDPAMPGVMQLKPRKKGALLDKARLLTIGVTGVVRGLISTAVFIAVFRAHTGEAGAWETGLSATFVTIVMTQFIGIFYLRGTGRLLSAELFSNLWLFVGIGLSALAMIAIVYVPALNIYLHTRPLAAGDIQVVALGLAVFAVFSSAYRLLSGRLQAHSG
ncbi:MAG TPA: cation-translocating P-type ATPase C-terminal domain-containing protein, partial [Turneriella sp.]|nr:cation-translocating P-type ATPase C-terminal domain-containing protein [Turneriella sp.]